MYTVKALLFSCLISVVPMASAQEYGVLVERGTGKEIHLKLSSNSNLHVSGPGMTKVIPPYGLHWLDEENIAKGSSPLFFLTRYYVENMAYEVWDGYYEDAGLYIASYLVPIINVPTWILTGVEILALPGTLPVHFVRRSRYRRVGKAIEKAYKENATVTLSKKDFAAAGFVLLNLPSY